MLTINLLSDCVTRDTLTNMVNRKEIKVSQYPCNTNIISMVSECKGDFQLKPEQLEKFLDRNFCRKGVCFDYNKDLFDYLFLNKSDYIAISFTPVRFNLLKKGDRILSNSFSNFFSNPEVNKLLGLNGYEKVSTFDISDDEWENAVSVICSKMLQNYTLKQIIYHKHYGVLEYNNNGILTSFSKKLTEEIGKVNQLLKKLDTMFLEKLEGCHVIEFPDNVIADKEYKWGLFYLHYVDDYYKYSEEAFRIIFNSVSEQEEKLQLSHLLENYNYRLKLLYDNLLLNGKINSLKYMYKLAQEARDFSKQLNLDLFGQNTFRKKLQQIKDDDTTVAVLKSDDTAGIILLKALASYGVEVVFSSPKASLEKLNDEEFQQCKSADMIISADIHQIADLQRDGIRAISILSLLND